MDEKFCKEHTSFVATQARIEEKIDGVVDNQVRLEKRINGAFSKIGKHIEEGDAPGGFRERIVTLEGLVKTAVEEKLNSVKASQWRIGIIAGTPGAIFAITKLIGVVKTWLKS